MKNFEGSERLLTALVTMSGDCSTALAGRVLINRHHLSRGAECLLCPNSGRAASRSKGQLCADCVDKRFGEGKRAILIQEGRARNIDSKSATLGFNSCVGTTRRRLNQQYLPIADLADGHCLSPN